jgi:hypothetical protein
VCVDVQHPPTPRAEFILATFARHPVTFPPPRGSLPHRPHTGSLPLRANEAAKLWVDDVLVAATPINGQSATGSRASANLTFRAGTSHMLVLDYYNAWNTMWFEATVSINGAPHVQLAPSMVRCGTVLWRLVLLCLGSRPPPLYCIWPTLGFFCEPRARGV